MIFNGKKKIVSKTNVTPRAAQVPPQTIAPSTTNLLTRTTHEGDVTHLKFVVWLGLSPLPVRVTTRIITFLVGNPYKPSFPLLLGGGTTQCMAEFFPLKLLVYEKVPTLRIMGSQVTGGNWRSKRPLRHTYPNPSFSQGPP